MVGKPSGKKGNTHAPGLVAPIKLGLAQLIEPDAVDQRLQALRYERRIHMGVSPLFLDQVAQPLELSQAFVIDLPAFVAIGWATFGLSPKGEPNREPLRVADDRVEIRFDHGRQLLFRLWLGLMERGAPMGAVFLGQISQRFNEQEFLALEMKVDGSVR
jgi:hypothetical protein